MRWLELDLESLEATAERLNCPGLAGLIKCPAALGLPLFSLRFAESFVRSA